VNVDLLQSTWREALGHGDPLIVDFYSRLKLADSDVAALFPADMTHQRAKVRATLNRVVLAADDLEAVVPALRQLGADHRRFGALTEHYPVVAKALLDTLEHFLTPTGHWTDEAAKTWTDALNAVADVMQAGAAEADQDAEPPCWDITVVAAHRPNPIGPAQIIISRAGLPHRPGDPAPVTVTGQPGSWWPARLDDAGDGLFSFTVTIDVDQPETFALAKVAAGDVIRIGPPVEPVDLEVPAQ
jgi:hemoglobin-like flavoprotein